MVIARSSLSGGAVVSLVALSPHGWRCRHTGLAVQTARYSKYITTATLPNVVFKNTISSILFAKSYCIQPARSGRSNSCIFLQ